MQLCLCFKQRGRDSSKDHINSQIKDKQCSGPACRTYADLLHGMKIFCGKHWNQSLKWEIVDVTQIVSTVLHFSRETTVSSTVWFGHRVRPCAHNMEVSQIDALQKSCHSRVRLDLIGNICLLNTYRLTSLSVKKVIDVNIKLLFIGAKRPFLFYLFHCSFSVPVWTPW